MKSTKANTTTTSQVSYLIPEKVQKSINRYKRQSKDITYDESVNFDGTNLPILNSEEFGAYRSILKTIHTQLSNMLTSYCKVFTIRFDLHFNPDDFDEAKISDLLKRIKKEYRKTGKVMHTWAREIDKSETPHYHCVIAFNGNKIQNPIKVFNSIVDIWNGTLKQPRPHLCKEGNYMISNTHDNIFIDAFKRHSYLAKIRTKDRQPPKKRNYGASQIKPAIRIKRLA
ncbi:MAG: inovirus-type Gp2 protein [Oleispira sp.]|nr:inovirus-type Gp2 protein [Oleispira sp.]MBL4880545.1 inovirus-type Gp2 protein [Oleispira sp.]